MTESSYHLATDNKPHGPYSLAQLQSMWRSRTITAVTLYWTAGQATWEPLGKISSLLEDPSPGLPPRIPDQAPPLPPPFPAGGLASPQETSDMAITSLVLGILGLMFFVTALPAVICGHLSLSRINKAAGKLKGRGMAIAGLIMGYLVMGMAALFAVMMGIAITAGIALPLLSETHQRTGEAGNISEDLANARKIGAAIQRYEHDFRDHTPPNLEALVPKYLPDHSLLISPLATDGEAIGYELLIPDTDIKTIDDPKTTSLLQSRHTTGKGLRSHVYVDGHGELKLDR